MNILALVQRILSPDRLDRFISYRSFIVFRKYY